MKADEEKFETEVADWLAVSGGYGSVKFGNVPQPDFDPGLGLDTVDLFTFIGATQIQEWNRLIKLYGGDADSAQKQFASRVARQLDLRGTVDVLRHGVVDQGVTIQLAYFKPAHGLTDSLTDRYNANRLGVTRQLRYESGSNSALDLCLFVNGLPVATAELKNPLTGQTVEHAIEQYRRDRDPRNTLLGRRAVVHFGVDTERVSMTTRLSRGTTRFLPFNKGHDFGAGNPVNPNGHRTAYLWEQVWARDAWLDLMARFVHAEKADSSKAAKSETVFPRFHQWDAVRRLEAAARVDGAGHDYLVEHSAGSGKSNTIAWLAHRLSSLHNDADDKVFDKIIVITDRRVLDKQLQDTIYQFEHAHGVVQKIDTDSAQLAEALVGQQARIIITTLQKFPIVLSKSVELPDRKYAVIVDEAHSSQTGEAAKDLKLVLGVGSADEQLTAAEAQEAGFAAQPVNDAEDALVKAAGARAKQSNISFIAFTATPKARTLELFGTLDSATGRYMPFHLYSMRQAIQEGFILDVLEQYVTYKTFWNIEKSTPDDPEYDPGKAKAAIARFVTLHDYNLAQKAEVIIEHFKQKVAHRVKGQAKAMVVTASRLHAVRYQHALRDYVTKHGYDIGVLVAFSGTVVDGGIDYTESNMNQFPETQTAEQFATGEWHVLVVAEKYQTGFDQPLLCAMYVDKVLSGLNAVQTLSRLNRIHPLKRQEDVFVLDFRNEAEDIRKSFEPWYGKTVAPPTDPNLLYDTRHQLDQFDVLRPNEVEGAVALIMGVGNAGDHGRIHSALAPSIDRFWTLSEEDQEEFRDHLKRFIRTYSFLSQIVAFTDVKLERDYVFCKALSAFLKPADDTRVDLGSEVELTYLRMDETFSGSVTLNEKEGEVTTIFGGGLGKSDADEERLSEIIDRINQRFGTNFDPVDRVFYDAIADKLIKRPDVQQAAAVNTSENFGLYLMKEFESGVVDQLAASEDMAIKYLDNSDMQTMVLSAYLPMIQNKAKVARQEHCSIGELLGPDRESATLEYKATLRTHDTDGAVFKPLETASLKTVAAFLNSRDGGTLLIGVADDGSIHGLASDYASLHKPDRSERDVFEQHIVNIISSSMGEAASANISIQIHNVDGSDVCRVHVHPSGFPVEARVTFEKHGQLIKKTAFFVRIANGTRELNDDERAKYTATRWSS